MMFGIFDATTGRPTGRRPQRTPDRHPDARQRDPRDGTDEALLRRSRALRDGGRF